MPKLHEVRNFILQRLKNISTMMSMTAATTAAAGGEAANGSNVSIVEKEEVWKYYKVGRSVNREALFL